MHENQRKRLDLSAQQFVNHPTTQPLPGFGVCRVPVCDRQARYLRGLCGTHYARWWDQDRQGLTTDFDAWCRTAAPIASGHAVIMRGLSSAVQAEILLGLQERCRRGVITYLSQLRIFTRRLRSAGVVTIADFDVVQLPRHVRRLGQELQDAISRGATPEAEQHKDVWDMGVFGHGRKRLDFTVIAQPWLRDTAKHWVLEELPLRRGPNIVAVLRDHVNSIGVLGNSLRLHRPDQGMHPAALGRADIVAFLNRLKHQESTGVISGSRRRKTAQHAALVLRECRAMGLARPDRPMAGLDPEFAFRRNDLPPVPKDDGPGRALPDSVLAALIAALDRLQTAAGRDARVAVQLLIDTGRRPAEICLLPWDCLDQDRDGKYALIYTDFKNNRVGCRLAISDATAELIIEHNQQVRERFPHTALADLALLPRTYRNPEGTQSISDDTLASAHRRWVDGLEPLRRPDETEFDKSAVFLYAYRHSYAQRHADNGTPVDVLRQLMDHRSIQTTGGYYTVTADRKRSAIETVGKLAIDKNGAPAPISGATAYQMRSVAVPFGNCIEPSNVKAGGKACPIRFQCAGCGFYRPDPSYIPAIEEHINSLTADREIASAMKAAPFVIDNLNAQIDAFRNVLTIMRRHSTDWTLSSAIRSNKHPPCYARRAPVHGSHSKTSAAGRKASDASSHPHTRGRSPRGATSRLRAQAGPGIPRRRCDETRRHANHLRRRRPEREGLTMARLRGRSARLHRDRPFGLKRQCPLEPNGPAEARARQACAPTSNSPSRTTAGSAASSAA